MSPLPPKVSVLVPVYKQAALVLETLNSIWAQNYPNLEVLVGDDASPDDTATVLKAYHATLPPERAAQLHLILHTTNNGISGNLNSLIEKATGDYLCITGGDDLFRPGRIAAQVAALEAAPSAGLCHTNMQLFASESRAPIRLFHAPTASVSRLQSLPTLTEANYVGGPCVMVRKSAVPPHGFDPHIPMASDWLFAIECGQGGIVYLPDVLMDYRITTTSITNRTGLMLDEAETTLHLTAARYPHLHRSVQRGLARVYRAQAAYGIMLGHLRRAGQLLWRSVKANPMGLTTPVLLGVIALWVLAVTEHTLTRRQILTNRLLARRRGR